MRSAERPVSTLGKADFLLMSLGFGFTLLVSALLGHGRIFWEDEMLGWMLLTDPSWHHMIMAWKMGADGGGFAFYLLGRGWLHLFGPSEMAYRLFSAVGFGLAFALTWATLRRYHGIWVVTFAMFNTYFCSQPLVLHMVEGRFYGLLVFALALTVWLAMKLQDYPASIPPVFYITVLVAHSLLVTSHILGVTYSFFVLAGMITLDLLAQRFRPVLYGTVMVTWLLLLPEREAIHASAQVGKPWFWTTQPTPIHLIGPLTGYSPEIVVVMLLVTIGIVATVLRSPDGFKRRWAEGWSQRKPIYVMSASFLLLAVSYLLEGFVGPVLFVSRYLMPLVILTAFLNAEMMSWVDPVSLLPTRARKLVFEGPLSEVSRYLPVTALVAVILFWDFVHIPQYLIEQRDYTEKLGAVLPKGIPVLLEDGIWFTEVIGRQHGSGVNYLFPLDWEQSTSAVAPRLEVTQYNLMNNWKKVGYFSGSIVKLDDFLATTPRFIVMDGQNYWDLPYAVPDIGNPLALRFARTPGYVVTRYSALERGSLVQIAWLVTHDPKTTGTPHTHGLQPRP